MIEKNVPTTAKNDRPIIVWRICSPVSRSFSSLEPADLVDLAPEGLRQQDAADAESVSSVIAVMSASVFWVVAATSRRARPTLTVSHRNNGIRHSDSSVSCTDRISIATNVEMITTTLDRIDDAVSVTTRLHAADVVGEARLDLARAGGREEPQRHVLQVRVERVAEVLHHAQPDEVRQVGLPDPDRPR